MKSLSPSDAESIALRALGFLGDHRERLDGFLALTGIELAGFRAAAIEPGFLIGVLDHFASDESLLLSFAREMGLSPVMVVEARTILAGPEGCEDP